MSALGGAMRVRLPIAIVACALLGAGDAVRDRFDTVVIDAGHGGEDEGAQGLRGLREKELVLDVAQRLRGRLQSRGLRVVMTRSGDRFVPLEERTSLANDSRGDLFVSIHANAARSRQARGSEIYFASLEASDAAAGEVAARENRALVGDGPAKAVLGDPLLDILGDLIATEHLVDSNEFARFSNAELTALDHTPSRGVKQAPFVVLLGVQMPASLIELGFLTNPQDERRLQSARWRGEIAGALERAVLEFGRRYDVRRGVEREHSLVAEEP